MFVDELCRAGEFVLKYNKKSGQRIVLPAFCLFYKQDQRLRRDGAKERDDE